MSKNEGSLGHPYNFPFTPYPQQVQLMANISECIQSSAVGCFESPTGTGKTLSTICASFTWLRDEENKIVESSSSRDVTSDTEDWLSAYLNPTQSPSIPNNSNRNVYIRIYQQVMEEIIRSNIVSRKERGFDDSSGNKTSSSRDVDDASLSSASEDYFILPSYDSDGETTISSHPQGDENDSYEEDREKEAWNGLELPQIYYCSRTHTQLAQFVMEIKKTSFKNIRCVILGSRKCLCINPDVQNLTSDQSMNEKCLELQSKKMTQKIVRINPTSDHPGNKKQLLARKPAITCPFHSITEEKSFSRSVLADIHDMEELSSMGKQRQVCSYYGARRAARNAQIICMPYSMLFHSHVRDSMGLKLSKNHVVIVDEAHNLVDALNQLYSTELRLVTVLRTLDLLRKYLLKFKRVLHGKNMFYLNMLITILKKLKAVLEGRVAISSGSDNGNAGEDAPEERLCSVNEFVFASALDNINFLKLKKFLNAHNFVNRIAGFAESLSEGGVTSVGFSDHSSLHKNISLGDGAPLYTLTECSVAKGDLRLVIAFISCLANQENDGRIHLRILVNKPLLEQNFNSEVFVKYIMLETSNIIKPIIENARCVLLLGGTMQPFQYFSSVLFRNVPPARQRYFTCNHIVEQSHVLARIVDTSNDVETIEFTHNKRLSVNCTTQLFEIILSLTKIIPKGLVVFFTSYQYMKLVHSRWLSNGMWRKLEVVKDIFIESKDQPSELIWENYCKSVANTERGAMLLSVVGGRLSEGINFSDDLARGVIMVGMPYPDSRDLVLQEKIQHLQHIQQNNNPSLAINLMENICMKSVNQAIGRSIRHAKDYSSIILIDHRYRQARIKSQLPAWIQSSLEETNLRQCSIDVERFFKQAL